MDLYGQKSSSLPQKVLIHTIELILIALSWWILFGTGGEFLERHLHIANAAGGEDRRLIIFVFNITIFLRIAYTMIFLLKRRIPWEESISVPMAFALYYIGFPLFVLPESAPLDAYDYLGIFLFLSGCLINSVSEILRDRWKKKPENKGRIYTGGLFRYARHINYSGDLLWVAGYAFLCKNWYSVSILIFLFLFFAFYNAPKLDLYLKDKYGKEYDKYAAKTKMLIPFIW